MLNEQIQPGIDRAATRRWDGTQYRPLRVLQITPRYSPLIGGVESHVVEAGDTLGSLAARYYGDAGQWRLILDANLDDIPDPGRLFPGRVLKIPAR